MLFQHICVDRVSSGSLVHKWICFYCWSLFEIVTPNLCDMVFLHFIQIVVHFTVNKIWSENTDLTEVKEVSLLKRIIRNKKNLKNYVLI